MPAAMTATWLSTGAIVIVGLTALAAVLAVPASGLGIMRGSTPPPTERTASRLAVLKDSGVQGEGPAASNAVRRPSTAGQGKGSGRTKAPGAAEQAPGKDRPGGSKGQGRSSRGAAGSKSSAAKTGTPAKRGSPQDQARDETKDQGSRTEDQADRIKEAEKDSSQDNKDSSKEDEQKSSREDQNRSDGANEPSRLPSLPFQAPSWFRALIIGGGVVALVLGLIRYGPTLLRALRDLLASLLGGLWIARPETRPKGQVPGASEPASPPRPFATFVNPFDSGLVQRFSPDELVVYSFEALEAWASEHNLGRWPHETPLEFVHRLGQARAALRQEATRLAGFFVTIVYGQRSLQAEVLPALRQFWRTLEGLPESQFADGPMETRTL
jgi:hypothetical protein